MEIRKIDLKKLNPAAYNPRKSLQTYDKEFEKLKNSIETFGYVEPIIVNKRGNEYVIVGGHQRYAVLSHLGYDKAECVVLELDDKHEKALNIALNKIESEWDMPALKDVLQSLDDGDFDVELTGFDVEEIEKLMTQFHVDDDLDGAAGGDDDNGYVIQYNIIFNDEDEQEEWHRYIKRLKDKYPDLETISERIIADIKGKK